jgi:DnaK suppressor protein
VPGGPFPGGPPPRGGGPHVWARVSSGRPGEGCEVDERRAAELLRVERDRIEAELSRLTGELVPENQAKPGAELDPADAAEHLDEREQDLGRIEDLRAELAAVARAEERLAQGTYGLSVESGEPIPDARLERMPTAERTIEEQRRLERRGG